jgi:hypothetical protein
MATVLRWGIISTGKIARSTPLFLFLPRLILLLPIAFKQATVFTKVNLALDLLRMLTDCPLGSPHRSQDVRIFLFLSVFVLNQVKPKCGRRRAQSGCSRIPQRREGPRIHWCYCWRRPENQSVWNIRTSVRGQGTKISVSKSLLTTENLLILGCGRNLHRS